MIQKAIIEAKKQLSEGKELTSAAKSAPKTDNKAVTKVSDSFDVKMNANDKLGDSDKALVSKTIGKSEEKVGKKPEEVKMNSEKKEGSDKSASTAVEVKSGVEEKGNKVTAGKAKTNFTSKTGNPKIAVSEPFDEKATEKINTMDKEGEKDAPKTFVDAGAVKGGNTVTAGQHKTVVKEKAPIIKDKEPIAKGIEIKEGYTKDELIKFIQSEARKIAKETIKN